MAAANRGAGGSGTQHDAQAALTSLLTVCSFCRTSSSGCKPQQGRPAGSLMPLYPTLCLLLVASALPCHQLWPQKRRRGSPAVFVYGEHHEPVVLIQEEEGVDVNQKLQHSRIMDRGRNVGRSALEEQDGRSKSQRRCPIIKMAPPVEGMISCPGGHLPAPLPETLWNPSMTLKSQAVVPGGRCHRLSSPCGQQVRQRAATCSKP